MAITAVCTVRFILLATLELKIALSSNILSKSPSVALQLDNYLRNYPLHRASTLYWVVASSMDTDVDCTLLILNHLI
jgi:hypothetical protein